MARSKFDHLSDSEKLEKIADAITWYVDLNGDKDKLLAKIAEIVNVELPVVEKITPHWRPPPGGGGITYRDASEVARTYALGSANVVEELWPKELPGQPTKKYRQVPEGKIKRVGDEV